MLPVVRPAVLLTAAAVAVLTVNVASLLLRLAEPTLPPVPVVGRESANGPLFGFLHQLLNVDGEGNVPTWLTINLLLVAALLCVGIAAVHFREHSRWRWHWTVLGTTFAYLSLDELAALHERAIPVMAQVVEARGVLTYAWVVLAAPLVLVFALAYLPFLRALPRRVAAWLVLSGAVLVTGALGMELVGGWVVSEGDGDRSAAYIWITSIEELLEMGGLLVCLYALMQYPVERPVASPAVPARAGREHVSP